MKIVVLLVVLYGHETWSLTPGEEHRLWVFENRVLRRISGHKKEVTRGWRKLHTDKLHNFHCSPNIIKVIKRRARWARHVACRGK
jgi:hypothetical protein